jgi:hypothetical protein
MVIKAIEGSPILGGSRFRIGAKVGAGLTVSQERDFGAQRTQGDGLFLKVDLGALIVGVGKSADQEKSHRDYRTTA